MLYKRACSLLEKFWGKPICSSTFCFLALDCPLPCSTHNRLLLRSLVQHACEVPWQKQALCAVGSVISRQMALHCGRKPAEQVRGRTQQAVFLSGLCFSPSSGSVTALVFLNDGMSQRSVERVKSFGI